MDNETVYMLPTVIDITDLKECYICRDEHQLHKEELQHYCDCKDLLVHHKCLLKWIQQGSGNEDRQSCKVCTASFQLQEGSVWRELLCHWQNMMLFVLLMGVMVVIPIAVHLMKTLEDPPPEQLFKIAAVCFGVVGETILIKCFIWYCTNQYSKARVSSYSIKPRTVSEGDGVGVQCPGGISTAEGSRIEAQWHEAERPKDTTGPKLLL